MRRTGLDCGAMSAFRGVSEITAPGDSSGSVANDPERTWWFRISAGACCRRAPSFRAERKSHTRARDRGRLATIICHATLPHA